ncbi:hypothetical protein B0G76_2193 [Paraburkholderia sp. BL23I1N1]|nr:hypothetical protein B0G76_2193 [Paraburkholderia sp. BL23I1N1]
MGRTCNGVDLWCFAVADKMAPEDTLHRESAAMEYRVSYEHNLDVDAAFK